VKFLGNEPGLEHRTHPPPQAPEATRGHFPDYMQPAITALPLTAFNDGLRAIFAGQDLGALLQPTILLSAYGLLSFLLALKIFTWE
jgi:hypothetical protein